MLKPIGLAPFFLLRVGLVGVCLVGMCLAGVSVTTTIAGQTPAPSLPATYATGAELMTALKKATDGNPDMSTAAVKNTDQYRINIVRRGKAAGAIAHQPGTEVHHIIDGAGTLVTGGTIVRAAGGGMAVIQGGESRHVVKGDVILIPENTPHWYKDVEGSITYLEVRFNVPVK
jgi:mannose-6-phosphate isomerase-like protein (cupin superfamily)